MVAFTTTPKGGTIVPASHEEALAGQMAGPVSDIKAVRELGLE